MAAFGSYTAVIAGHREYVYNDNNYNTACATTLHVCKSVEHDLLWTKGCSFRSIRFENYMFEHYYQLSIEFFQKKFFCFRGSEFDYLQRSVNRKFLKILLFFFYYNIIIIIEILFINIILVIIPM